MTPCWYLALQDRRDISVGAVGDDCANGRFLRRCQQQGGSTHRNAPAGNRTRAAKLWIGRRTGFQKVYRAQHIALLKVSERERLGRRVTRAAHVERQDGEAMLRKVDAQLQQSRVLIGAVGAIAMHYDDGALRRQFTVGEYAWNEPALQLHLVDAAGKGYVAELHSELRRGSIQRCLGNIGQLRRDVQRKAD